MVQELGKHQKCSDLLYLILGVRLGEMVRRADDPTPLLPCFWSPIVNWQ